jgi:hypothetical protein
VLTDSEKIGVSLPVRGAPNDPEELRPFSSFRSIEQVAIGRVGRLSPTSGRSVIEENCSSTDDIRPIVLKNSAHYKV